MHNKRLTQLELFSQNQEGEQSIVKPVDLNFLNYIKLYEKTILVVIGLVIIAVAAFCFGVEKGKAITVSSSNTHFDVISFKGQNLAPLKSQLKIIPVEKESILKQNKNIYTIQIASYQVIATVKKEMAKLKAKGLSPWVIKKTGYYVVCVGTFNNKETAGSLLAQLKSEYRDCCIRRL